MSIAVHDGDLPAGLDFGASIAIDTETMGLDPRRDRLCVVQLSDGSGDAHLVQVLKGQTRAPNLERLLADPAVLKLFHFGRFDIAVLKQAFGVTTAPVWCTKIASRLIRTFTDRHGLKYLLAELVGVDVSKQQQTSDWGSEELSEAQKEYAASDVLYLHRLKDALDLLTFFTIGDTEARSWTLREGETALDAAEAIHSDIARGFIRCEVIRWDDLLECGSHSEAARRGLQRLEGKTYLVRDGDVLHVRFNV